MASEPLLVAGQYHLVVSWHLHTDPVVSERLVRVDWRGVYQSRRHDVMTAALTVEDEEETSSLEHDDLVRLVLQRHIGLW